MEGVLAFCWSSRFQRKLIMDLVSLGALIREIQKAAPGRRIIFGSSSLIAPFPGKPPGMIGVELTKDADIFIEPDDADLRERLEAVFGEAQAYERLHGFSADFVDLRASGMFAAGWRDRLTALPDFDDVVALEAVDVAANKVMATAQARILKRLGKRQEDRGTKDINTVAALLAHKLIDLAELNTRIQSLDFDHSVVAQASTVIKQIIDQASAIAPPSP